MTEEIKKKETPKTDDIISKAEAIAKRIEEGNKRTEELLKIQEQQIARVMLSGRAEAGTVAKTPEEEKNEMLDKLIKTQLAKYR